MSYDLEIGTHREPTRAQVEAWVAERELTVEADEGGFSVARALKRGDGHLFRVDGPTAAEAGDFDEAVAAACLAPRWMTRIEVPYGTPKTATALARALAKRLAEANEGAAFDPQTNRLISPTGTPTRVEPRRERERTSVVELAWCVPEDRWDRAPAALIGLIGRRCPEALPARYGRWEPLEHRFDPERPSLFLDFVLDKEETYNDGFWFAKRPSFGGSWGTPDRKRTGKRLRVGELRVSFDGRVLEQDARWRETVVELFVAASAELTPIYAAAQVRRGWIATASNRLWADGRTESGEALTGRNGHWHGLPPMPMWLNWFGEPYKDVVAPHVSAFTDAKPSILRRLLANPVEPLTPHVEHRPNGLFVRLGDQPRAAKQLGTWPIPHDLLRRPDE